MKKEIPMWAVISMISVVVIIAGFFIFKAVSGPGDLPAPKIKVKEEVPSHLKGKISPEMEQQIREQTKKFGEVDPNAPAGGAAPGPPSGN